MKQVKVIAITLAVLLAIGGSALAAPNSGAPANVNAHYVGIGGQPHQDQMQEYILVRNGWAEPSASAIASGDVLRWDVNSGDGYTVSEDAIQYGFAGVAVTDIATADSGAVNYRDNQWGFMCIRGYCLAQVDTSNATVGLGLCQNGATLKGSFGTGDQVARTAYGEVSQDLGVLLYDTSSDGMMPVWLR